MGHLQCRAAEGNPAASSQRRGRNGDRLRPEAQGTKASEAVSAHCVRRCRANRGRGAPLRGEQLRRWSPELPNVRKHTASIDVVERHSRVQRQATALHPACPGLEHRDESIPGHVHGRARKSVAVLGEPGGPQ